MTTRPLDGRSSGANHASLERRSMIGYVTLGTNDLARSTVFYDAIAKELGTGRMMETEQFVAWGAPGGAAGIGFSNPFDGPPGPGRQCGLGGLAAKGNARVDRLPALAPSLRGRFGGAAGTPREGV